VGYVVVSLWRRQSQAARLDSRDRRTKCGLVFALAGTTDCGVPAHDCQPPSSLWP